jgi:hypothetical protein
MYNNTNIRCFNNIKNNKSKHFKRVVDKYPVKKNYYSVDEYLDDKY